MKTDKISRRALLKSIGITGASVLLSSCMPSAATMPAEDSPSGGSPGQARKLIRMWYQAENHTAEYEGRKKEFEESFAIELTYELIGRDAMSKKLAVVLMSGSDIPNIVEQNADDIVKYMKGSDPEIPFMALNEVIESEAYSEKVLASRWARYSKDGKIYGAPHDVHPIVWLYNDAAWQEYGIDLAGVKTWEDLLAMCQTLGENLKMADGSERFAIMDGINAAALPTFMLQNDVWWTGEDGEPMLTHLGFTQAVEGWLRFKHYRTDIDWANHAALLKAGQVMSQPAPDWFYGIHKQVAQRDPELMKRSPMRVMSVPNGPKTGSWGGTAASIVKQSERAEEAAKILLYIYFENGEKQLDTRWRQTGILPPVPTAWESDVYNEPDDFVGGQKSGQVFIEAAKALPAYYENWKTNLVIEAWNEQASLVWEEQISVDEAIDKADAQARNEIKKNA